METINLAVPTAIEFEIGKTGDVVRLDTARLPVDSILHMFAYGAKQSANDYNASLVRKTWTGTDAEFDAENRAYTQEWIERAYAGTLGTRVARTRKPDPLAEKVRALAVSKNIDPNQEPDALMAALMEAFEAEKTEKKSRKAAA